MPGSILEELAAVDQDKPLNKFNDAKCDSEGRLWCGTMTEYDPATVKTSRDGSLFSFSAGNSIPRQCLTH